jgi:hypothetical protein
MQICSPFAAKTARAQSASCEDDCDEAPRGGATRNVDKRREFAVIASRNAAVTDERTREQRARACVRLCSVATPVVQQWRLNGKNDVEAMDALSRRGRACLGDHGCSASADGVTTTIDHANMKRSGKRRPTVRHLEPAHR